MVRIESMASRSSLGPQHSPQDRQAKNVILVTFEAVASGFKRQVQVSFVELSLRQASLDLNIVPFD